MAKIKTLTADLQPDLPDAKIRYYQKFLSNQESNYYFDTFSSKIPWQQDEVKVFGKIYAQPRLTSLHSKTMTTYKYAGLTLKPQTMTNELLSLLERVESICNCLLYTSPSPRD